MVKFRLQHSINSHCQHARKRAHVTNYTYRLKWSLAGPKSDQIPIKFFTFITQSISDEAVSSESSSEDDSDKEMEVERAGQKGIMDSVLSDMGIFTKTHAKQKL